MLQVCNKLRKLFQNIAIHQKLVQAHENNTVIIGIGSDVITLDDNFLKGIAYFL